jgi:ABC-type lipoprotein export system ATPase subunit
MTLLSLQSVSRSFWRGPTEIPILRDVTLDVATGDLVAVHGRRGAGKTTLLKVAAGFDAPDRGDVLFDGEPLAGFSRQRLAQLHRERIAWVERTGPHSRELPIRDYLALPLYGQLGPRAAHRRAAAVLAKVGIRDCVDRRWDDISDAERILVAIAHALVREPQLVVGGDAPTRTGGV